MDKYKVSVCSIALAALLVVIGAPTSGVEASDQVNSSSSQRPYVVAQSHLSSTCQFTQGPKAGRLQGMVEPVPVGSPCTDGQGSFGTAMSDPYGGISGGGPGDPDGGISGGGPGATSEQLSSTCRFDQGPRAGSFQGMVQPIPVGSPCTDGQGSFGTAIAD
jgi:hypothetical protein